MFLTRSARLKVVVSGAGVAAAVVLAGCGGDGGHDMDSMGGDSMSAPASTSTTAPSTSTGATAQFNDADVMFAQMMYPHHAQAVEMAELVQGRTTNPQVIELAAAIKAAQGPEMAQLQQWLQQWGKPAPSADMGSMDHGSDGMSGMMSEQDMTELEAKNGAEFDQAWEPTADPVERARRLVVRAQMGFGSAGATKGKTGFRIDSQRAYGTAQHHWLKFPDGLAAIADRFSGVLVENRPAIEVMRQHDTPQTLHYVDPPYVHSTRVMQAGKAGYYKHEMAFEDHQVLLAALLALRGMVVVSGYRTELYDETLTGWQRVETRARISAGRGGATRTECLWISPAAQHSGHQHGLPLEAIA